MFGLSVNPDSWNVTIGKYSDITWWQYSMNMSEVINSNGQGLKSDPLVYRRTVTQI